MKAKRQRDRERDATMVMEQAVDNGEQTDWQEALREWEEWENSNKE